MPVGLGRQLVMLHVLRWTPFVIYVLFYQVVVYIYCGFNNCLRIL